MLETDLPPISLAILHQGRSLCVSVSDSRSVGRVATIDTDRDTLADLRRESAALLGAMLASTSQTADDASSGLRELGSRLFRQLLPEAAQTFLARCSTRDLMLQLSESLLSIPWEAAHDGSQFLGEKFRICRHVVDEDELERPPRPPPGPVLPKVLLIGAGSALAEPRSAHDELVRRLRGLDGMSVATVDAAGVEHQRLLALIAESDIVHVDSAATGRLAPDRIFPGWSQARTRLPAASSANDLPRLLVVEKAHGLEPPLRNLCDNVSLARAACRSGTNLLQYAGGPGGEGATDLLGDLFDGLADGQSVAQAIRMARGNALRRGGAAAAAALSATLYGEPGLALHPPRSAANEDNLRQVTIMSFDLVDSTRLLAALGAEKYSEVLAAYHRRCTDSVGRFGGRPNDPQGNDGFMCYFGFPTAREDSAAQALRAGLAIVDAVAELGLTIRVGIVTGRVVVKEGQPFGPPIHLAARLQAIAEPATVVVGDSTCRLVTGKFEFERLEHVPALKGIEDPGPVYRLRREAQADLPDAADRALRHTPFVGRHRELQLLQEHWTVAAAGAVRLVCVAGDAGIGKSRLVREFRRRLQAKGHRAFECHCAAEHAASALHPFIELLRRLMRIQPDETIDSKLDKIERILHSEVDVDDAPALLSTLLSVPYESRYSRPLQSADKQRQLTLDILIALVRRQTRRAPTCLIFEDINWIDPSSKELLDRLLQEAGNSPLLVLFTQRSDTERSWHPERRVFEIELKSLSPEQARLMVLGASGTSELPREVVHLLAARTDGVPLFIEESTRMLVELGVGTPVGGAVLPLDVDVPPTLHDLLMARLDRLGPAKLVAQVGGTIGREFSPSLLAAVLAHPGSPVRVPDMADSVASLVQSGLLIEADQPPDTRLLFKHALIRDAAYRSLLERDRKSLHRIIAVVLGEQFKELAETQPELLAHHYTQAQIDVEAVAFWERAARRAASRSAHLEAISHLAQGLSILDRLPAGVDRDRTELRLQLLLASRFIATEGYGADRVERVYSRALELCRLIGDETALMKVQLGLEGFHFMRGDFAQAMAFAGQAAAMAQRSADAVHDVQAAWAIANVLFHQGEMADAVRRVDTCLAEYDKLQHRPGAVQDPGVICLCYSAWGKWELGYPDQAMTRARRVVELAEGLGHRFSLGEAYGFRSTIHYFRREHQQALAFAERAIEVCDEGGFVVWLAHAKLMHGRLIVANGDAAGIDEMREGYELWTATGAVVTRAFYLALRAEGLAQIGRPDEGLALLEQALQIVRRCGERYYEAEIRRLYGELMLQATPVGKNQNHEAETWFLGALERAHAQQLRSLALRSALSLARLRLAEERRADAIRVLAPAYDWFSEGFVTGDLKDARRLLVALDRTPALG